MKRKVAHIKWDDACSQKGPVCEEDFDPHFYVNTFGLIVRDDKDFITIAQDTTHDGSVYREICHIPKKMIVRKRIVGTVEID